MRDRVTNLLDVAGLVLLSAAGGALVATWSAPGALATSGMLLLGSSALLESRRPKPRSR